MTVEVTDRLSGIAQAPFPRGHIFGLGTARNGASDLDIASGECRDSENTVDMVLSATLTKTEAAWAVGNNEGGLDSGTTFSNSTWYYVYLIKNAAGVVDALFSASKTAPTLPSGYTVSKMIGAFYSDSSGNIVDFKQSGDYFHFPTSVIELDTTTPAIVWTAINLTRVPPIDGAIAMGNVTLRNTSTTIHQMGLTHGDVTGPTNYYEGEVALANYVASANAQETQNLELRVNASGQIQYAVDSATSIRVILRTTGFQLPRASL